jgi:hypothetical protein
LESDMDEIIGKRRILAYLFIFSGG